MPGIAKRVSSALQCIAGAPLGRSCREAVRQLHAGATGPLSADFQLSTVRAESFYDSTVEKFAAQDVEVLSLRQMLSFGRSALNNPEKILKSARYVQRELPKRLARRLLDLQLLPYIVVTNPHIKKVYNQYYVSFEFFRRMPKVRTLEDNAEFCHILRQHLDSHAPMLDSLATGLREVKSKELVGGCLQMDSFFDLMLRSRINRRVMAEQHLHLANKRPAFIGTICTDLDVHESIDFAVQKTRQVCMETYGTAPEVVVSGDPGVNIPYIPAHLDYMLYELLKNAMRAVVEFHRPGVTMRPFGSNAPHSPIISAASGPGGAAPARLPPVAIRVCGGSGGLLSIRISDQGGGIPDSMIEKVWSYGFTTIGHPSPSSAASSSSNKGNGKHAKAANSNGNGNGHEDNDVVEGLGSIDAEGGPGGARGNGGGAAAGGGGGGGGGVNLSAIMRPGSSRYQMAGLGFGLPLSRVYARYFGGDLKLQSIPGYGVDAYLQLRRLEEHEWAWTEQVETSAPLPIKTPY